MIYPSPRSGELIMPGLHANSGGPMSRTRKERIDCSVLGADDGFIRCPRIIRLGLAFQPRDNPVVVLTTILQEEGFASPEDLRDRFEVPQDRLVCSPLRSGSARLVIERTDRDTVLEQALLLGLCTKHLFDPLRPVLWTEASLTRGLELFHPQGFYA